MHLLSPTASGRCLAPMFRLITPLLLALALLTPAFAQTTFTNSVAITCAVGGGGAAGNPGTACAPYPSNIAVSGMAGTISNLQVRLNGISIDRQQDMIAVLVGPNGSNLVFISDAGNSSTTSSTGITLTFSDAAANLLDQTTTFVTGTYKPSGHNTGLASNKDNFPAPAPAQASLVYPTPFGTATLGGQFNGINPNGTWSLYVIDDSLGPPAGSGGVLGINITGGWSLIVTTAIAAAPTVTTVSSSANPSFTGNSVTFTATVTSSGNPVTLGTVQFFEGATALSGAVALNGSGQAAFATTALAEGNHTIRADYSGATGFASSNGTVIQQVNNATAVTGSTFCNPGAITVVNDVNSPIATPYPSRIFVSGLGGTISSMNLEIKGLTGGRADDFEMLLVGPNGNKFVVLNDVGGANAVSGVNLTLNDGAASQLPDETVFGSGTFRPTAVNSTAANFPAPAPAAPYNFAAPFGASTFAANFGGISPNGTWQLFFVDDSGGGAQSVIASGWCLSFVTTSDAASTTTVTSSLNPSFTTAPSNSVTFTATVRNAATSALVTVGSVTFLKGTTVLAGPTALNGSGQASFTTTSLTEGVHVITVSYSGAAGQFNLSQGTFSQTVDNHTVVTGNQFCNPGPLTVPTSGVAIQYPARIFVSGLSGLVSKVTLSLRNMNGVRPDDLDILLVGPTGARFVVMSDAGGPTDSAGITLTLADAAGNLVPDNGPLSNGTFRPSSYTPAGQGADAFASPAPAGPHNEAAPTGAATFASTFQGTNPNGTWQVFVVDDSLGGPGSFTNGVCLDFTLTPTVTASTANLAANATTITIAGTGFDAVTPGNNTVTFNDGATGTVTAATATSLTVSFAAKPAQAGSLTAVVTNTAGNSGAPVQVATVTPVVTLSTAQILATAATVTINGFGFANANASNSVLLSSGSGNVTSSSPTQIVVTFTAEPTAVNLTAVITSNTISSGAAVQVATVELRPTVSNVSKNATEDVPAAFAAADFTPGSYSDPNGDPLTTVRITSLPTNGVLKISGSTIVAVPQDIAIANIGTLTYTSNLNYNGADSFGWNGSDGTLFATSGATVNVTVNAVNDKPTFTAANPPAVNEDAGAQSIVGWATFNAGAANESGQAVLSYAVSSVSNAALFSAGPSVAANGTLTYTPATNANGTSTFQVRVQDNGGAANGGVDTSDAQIFTIMVNAVNDPPVITGQFAVSTTEAMPRPIFLADLTVTDSDNTYPTGFALLVQNGANYTRTGATITPVSGFVGTLIVPVQVNDGAASSNVFNLIVTVNPTDAHAAIASSIAPEPGGGVRVSFLGNPGVVYVVQSTNGLTPVPTAWKDLGTRTADATGRYSIVDIPPANTPMRFYRAVRPYRNNFNTGLGTATLIGSATLTNQAVQLTDVLGSQTGSVVLTGIAPGPAFSGFTARFTVAMGPTSGTPADGISFAVGDMGAVAFGENGPATAHILTVALDTYENGAGIPEALGIRLLSNGTVLAYNATNPYTNSLPVPVEVSFDIYTGATVKFNGATIFTNVAVPGFTFQAGDRFGFGGRTGGADERNVVDDVEITPR